MSSKKGHRSNKNRAKLKPTAKEKGKCFLSHTSAITDNRKNGAPKSDLFGPFHSKISPFPRSGDLSTYSYRKIEISRRNDRERPYRGLIYPLLTIWRRAKEKGGQGRGYGLRRYLSQGFGFGGRQRRRRSRRGGDTERPQDVVLLRDRDRVRPRGREG